MDTAHGPHRHGLCPDRRHQRVLHVVAHEPESGGGAQRTHAWAVGIYRHAAEIGHTLALHWDGTRWSQVKTPNPGSIHNSLASVSAVSSKDVWAVGDYQEAGTHALVLHWDGTRWSHVNVHRDR
jgi:hypothetical protein